MCKIESQQGEWLTNSPSVKATVLRNGLKQSREEENGLHTFYFPQPSSIKTQIDVFLCERPDHNLPGKSWKQIQVEHVRTTLKTRISVLRLFNMLLICV